jgi:chromosome segregation ATPase
MNSEERFERIEQKIEFIVNQQAQFVTDLQALQGVQAAVQLQINKLNEAMLTLAMAQVRTEAKLAALAEAQARTEEGMRRLEEKGTETEERLNAFINFVERYLSDRQKEEPEGESRQPEG